METERPPTTEQLTSWAVRLTLAAMSSASTDNISPINWWTRAKSALETAAQSSDHFSGMVATMGRKLQIDAYQDRSAAEVVALATEIGAHFDAFARHCAAEALVVVAFASQQRKDEREEYLARSNRPRSAPLAPSIPRDDMAADAFARLKEEL